LKEKEEKEFRFYQRNFRLRQKKSAEAKPEQFLIRQKSQLPKGPARAPFFRAPGFGGLPWKAKNASPKERLPEVNAPPGGAPSRR